MTLVLSGDVTTKARDEWDIQYDKSVLKRDSSRNSDFIALLSRHTQALQHTIQ